MIYFVSDCHFGHTNILAYENETRGMFNTIEEMNEKLIENWNSVIKPDDKVYMLGDMFMGKISIIDEIMPRLNGTKVLIKGNHDTKQRVEAMKKYVEYVESIDTIFIKEDNLTLVLCHYPMREWEGKDRGSIHLYGHVHSNQHRNGVLAEKNSYHIGVDTNNLTPVSYKEIKRMFRPCFHPTINTETCHITGEIEYYICAKCGEVVQKYIVNDKYMWV